MKTIYFSIVSAILMPISNAQQSPNPPPLVSTHGGAEIRVVPDLADLSFGVEVRNLDLTEARKQQADRVAKVIAALRAAGVSDSDVQTSQLHITADYSDRRGETEKAKFYRVSQSISCTLHEMKKVPYVTADVVAAALAGALEAKIGKPYSITEGGSSDWRYNPGSAQAQQVSGAAGGESGDATQPTFAPGMIRVTANVEVSFLLE